MFKGIIKTVFFATVLFYLPLRSLAWGQQGHRIVGEIADSYLTAKARAEIQKILGTESMAIASTWADFIKSDTTYKYLNAWHYADFPKGLSASAVQTELQHDTTTDAYTRLNFLVSELKKKNLPQDKKLMYLRLVIHIVGDIHQPLHVSPDGDAGGNDIKVSWFGQSSNLHRVWDEQIIDDQKLSYTEYTKAINHTTISQRKKWQSQPISEWMAESYELSVQLHNEIKDANPKLSYVYIFNHLGTVNQQLLKGGVHLAGLLNQIFG